MTRDMLRHARGRVLIVAALLLVLFAAVIVARRPVADALDPDASSRALAAQPCHRSTTEPAHYKHVVWIWMENQSYKQVIGSEDAPFENSLAHACGLATDYRAITHPSLPNYLAATGGSTFGVTKDESPSSRPIRAPTVFSEVARTGRQWRTYDESMSGNCSPVGRFGYARNPAAYFTGADRLCARWDVPMGTVRHGNLAAALAHGRLPAFSLMIPNLCHATHSCPVSRGDTWLSHWVNRIITSRSYQNGSTAIFLTWDEGKHDVGQHIPLIVVSPTTAPGTASNTAFDHYSLLRTTANLLGINPPGNAADAASMQAAFGL
jgi:phospholipase C